MRSSTRAELSVVAAGASCACVLACGLRGPSAVVLMLVGLAGSLLAAHHVRASASVPRSLWPTVAALTVLAVVAGPIASHDLWSYSSYGRMVSHYGVDPYRAVPAMFPHDVVYPVVGWRNTPSGYGPLFTTFSAALTWVAGDSLLAVRLGFQVLAAGSVLWCLTVLARRRRRAALTLVALQPFVWISLVNGGHNDAIVGAILLAAVLAFDRDRIGRCAGFVVLAVLVKLTAVFVVVPLVGMLIVRRRFRDAAGFAVLPLVVLLGGQLLLPGSLTNASTATRGIITRASIWRPLHLFTGVSAATVAMTVIVVLVGWVAWRHRRDTTAARAAGTSLSVLGMLSSYTLPWYLFLGTPALAFSGDLVMLGIVSTRATLMAASYQTQGTGGVLEMFDASAAVASAVLVAAFIWRASMRSERTSMRSERELRQLPPRPTRPGASIQRPSGPGRPELDPVEL